MTPARAGCAWTSTGGTWRGDWDFKRYDEIVDYRNCQFQDTKGLELLRSVAGEYFPATCRAGRRVIGNKLATFGRVEEEVVVGGTVEKPSSWRQTLDVMKGESICENGYSGGTAVDSTAFVAQGCPVFAVQKRFRGEIDRYVFKWVFRHPGLSGKHPLGLTYEIMPGKIAWRIDRPEKKVVGGLAGKPVYADLSITGSVTLACSDPAVKLACDGDTLYATLERPRGEVAFTVSFRDSMDGKGAPKGEFSYQDLKAAHERTWKDYWGEFFIDIPDKKLECVYYTVLYNLKCWSTKWAVPIGIQPQHWEGRIFGFGFNAAAFAGAGKFEEAKKIGRFWRSIINVARWRAGSQNKDHGHKEPEYVENGIRYSWETLEDGQEGSTQGRWLDHYMHQGAIAADCWNGYLYSGDREFLRGVYPVIKGTALHFAKWLVQERDGKTIIGPVCDLERLPCPLANAFLTTCSAISCLEKAASAAEVLGVDLDRVAGWRVLAAKLREGLPRKDGRYLAAGGLDETSVGTLAGLFPYNAVAKDDPCELKAMDWFDEHGVLVGNMYKVGTRVCTWYAAWLACDYAQAGNGEKAYANLVRAAQSVGHFNEIYEINEKTYKSVPWCQAPQATFIQALHAMLVDDVVPVSWKNRYHCRLVAPGGKIVSR